MKYNPSKHHRQSIRLKQYDYSSAGAYFVTAVVHKRTCVFGSVHANGMHLNDIGKIANQCLKNIPDHLSMVELDEFVIMPNHIHGIIVVVPDDRISRRDLINQTPTNNWILMKHPKQTLGKILRWYKARAAKIIHDSGETGFQWQRNYYDHIIRNESELTAIRNYISNNPIYWWHDIENPNTESERFQR